MPEKLKINIVLPFFSTMPGGGLKVMYQYANKLSENGHQVIIYHSMYTAWTQEGRLFRKVKHLFFQKYLRIKRVKRPTWFNLAPEIKSFEIVTVNDSLIRDADIVLSTWWATAFEVSALSKNKGEKFNLIQDYEAIMTKYPERVDQSFKLDMHLIVISVYLSNLIYGIAKKKPAIIPNAVNASEYYIDIPIKQRSPYSVSMLYADDPRKGSYYGIEALKIVSEKYPQLKVRLFGTYSKPVHPFPNTFEYTYLPDDLLALYNQTAIFISPSIHEGWGLPAMEAMACGCACVCTNIEGHLDFMIDGQTALLTGPGNPKAMAEKIIELIDDNNLRIRLAEAANKRVHEFSWDRSCAKLEQLFYKSLAERGNE
jgi:glycosyltransferase involved in cell wall biosynthesis